MYRPGKRYQAILHFGGNGNFGSVSSPTSTGSATTDHGLTLELGAYIAKIQPGSIAAKEGSIAVGDRIVTVR